MNRKQLREAAAQLELEQLIAQSNEAREAGHDYFHGYGDLLLVAVARHGAKLYPDKARQIAFLQGYSEARQHHEAFERGE